MQWLSRKISYFDVDFKLTQDFFKLLQEIRSHVLILSHHAWDVELISV